MGKKRVPISLRKPSSPDAAAARAKGKPEAEPTAAPEPETTARVAEPEIAALVVEPEIAARVAEPELAPTVEPVIAAPVAEPEVVARVAEPEVAARVAEPEVAPPIVEVEIAAPAVESPAVEALQRLVPEAPPAIIVGADGRVMRAVTVYLPAEMADQLVVYCRDKGLDVVREAIEASLGKRIGTGAGPARGVSSADTARAVPPWVGAFREIPVARGLVTRIERWMELGRAVMTTLRVHVRTVGAEAGAPG